MKICLKKIARQPLATANSEDDKLYRIGV